MSLVRDYVFAAAADVGHEPPLRVGGFELATTYPRRVLKPADDGMDVRAAGLAPQATLAVTALGETA